MGCLSIAAVCLIAASSPTPVDPPPSALAPDIQNGSFEPGDFRWLRGQFDGANAADKAADASIREWAQRCRSSNLATTRVELENLGIHPGDSVNSIPYRTLICSQVSPLPEILNLHDWQGSSRDVTKVQPIAQAFLAALTSGRRQSAPSDFRTHIFGRLRAQKRCCLI